jgi:signal transduction histidine kinase
MKIARPPRADVIGAAAVSLVGIIETTTSSTLEATPPYYLAALCTTVPLAWRRAAPVWAFAGVGLSAAVFGALDGDVFESAYSFISLLLAIYSVAANDTPRRAALCGVAIAVVVGVGFTIDPGRGGVGDYVFVLGLVGGFWTLGYLLRERGLHNVALQERALRAEHEREERARAAVAEERARIARELHDVVAHSLSVMLVQTGVVRRRIRGDHPGESELLAEIESTGRGALSEMRRLLGILRTEGVGAAELQPQPGLDTLEPLVDSMREAGLPVALSVEGSSDGVSPGLGLAAYRIVQESLTNALKHAGGASASVRVAVAEDAVDVSVTDDGRGVDPASDGLGHGLVGMRERVALYGGRLETGPLDGGGYRVHARLPLEASEVVTA